MRAHANQIVPGTQARWLPIRPDAGASISLVRQEQAANGGNACFMTEKRLLCQDLACTLRVRCRRLVAAWKR